MGSEIQRVKYRYTEHYSLSYNICEDASGVFKTEDEEVQTQIREDSSAVHTHTHTHTETCFHFSTCSL